MKKRPISFWEIFITLAILYVLTDMLENYIINKEIKYDKIHNYRYKNDGARTHQ